MGFIRTSGVGDLLPEYHPWKKHWAEKPRRSKGEKVSCKATGETWGSPQRECPRDWKVLCMPQCADAPLFAGISRMPGKPYGGRSGGLSYKRRPVSGYRRAGYQGCEEGRWLSFALCEKMQI